MLAQYVLPTCVRPSVTSGCSVKTAKQIVLGFDTEATVRLFYGMFYTIPGIFGNKGTSLWNFVPNSGKFRNCTSTVAGAVNFGGRRM